MGSTIDNTTQFTGNNLLCWRREMPTGQSEWFFLEDDQDAGNNYGGTPIDGWPLILREDRERGRYVVAARDLKLGELVCAEEPFVYTVHECALRRSLIDILSVRQRSAGLLTSLRVRSPCAQ